MEREEDVKVKPLQKALERMEDKLESMGYEIVDLAGKPYVKGMTVEAHFIPDENISKGESIILRVIQPQVNFRGRLIQVPKLEVGVG